MQKDLIILRAGFLFVFLASLLGTACGGGTTGTSSTDSVKFAGYAEQANGDRAPNLMMTVKSFASNQELEVSSSDAQGDFAMELPASENSLVVGVDGVGSTLIQRQQLGAGQLSAKLKVEASGRLVAEDIFEVQIAADPRCTAVSVSGMDLEVRDESTVRGCELMISTVSRTLKADGFIAVVDAECEGQAPFTKSYRADGKSGAIAIIDFGAIEAKCNVASIEVTHILNPGLRARFGVGR